MLKKTDSNHPFFSFYNEVDRNLFHFEERARAQGFPIVAGVVAEGSNALAGPIVSAACITPEKFLIKKELEDVESLSPKQIRDLHAKIISYPGIVYAIEVIDPSQIIEVNIFEATLQGLLQSANALSKKPDFFLVSGPLSPFSEKTTKILSKGHTLSYSVACAYILATKTREAIMDGYDQEWPEYHFNQNNGYKTPDHLKILKEIGPSPIHHTKCSIV